MSLDQISLLLIAIGSILFFARRAKRYLRFLQQQDYQNDRYVRWVIENRAFDRRGSLIAAAVGLSSLYLARTGGSHWMILLVTTLGVGVLLLVVRSEEDPTKAGKLKLNMTERATRIFQTALVPYALLVIVITVMFLSCGRTTIHRAWFTQIILIQSIPLWLGAANRLLSPFERRIQERFLGEARSIWARVHPYTIGITGSYGKTSTKSILGEIMNACVGPTFWPPKSYNTLMGITREIRENLRPGTKYAVIEMGAYGRGSITKLCALTPPQAAIVTAVGIMHLERFGSPENVYLAKSELAKAVPQDGLLVGNGDDKNIRRMFAEHKRDNTLFYGFDAQGGKLDCTAQNIRVDSDGTHFDLIWRDKLFPNGFTKLLGKPSLSNILGAITAACALGGDPELVLAAVRNIEPVKNRLSIRRERIGPSAEVVFLDDAYNSNPIGFRAALEVLQAIPAKRKILVTPGMVELGAEQTAENSAIGELAGKICDTVFLVGETNRDALASGLKRAGLAAESIRICKDRDEALRELTSSLTAGDVVLIENDLPDLYEFDTKF